MKVIKGLKVLILLLFTVCAQSAQDDSSPEIKPVKVEQQTIVVGKGPDAMFLTPDENILYIANVEDTFISVIDTRSDKVVQTIDGTDYPWGFTRLGESNEVAVSGWDKGIDIIDFTTHKIVRSKRYEQNLGGIASTKNGEVLFVIAIEGNQVLQIDGTSLEIIDDYPTGSGPDGVGISKDGSKIYVTNTKDGTISVITLASKKVDVIATGGKPELIHYNHDHSRLFISNFFKNKVHVLNTETDKIVTEITGLDGPEEAVLSRSEEILFVVNFNSSKVFTYDARTYQKKAQEFSVGTKPIGVVSAAKNAKLYVTNYGDNALSVIKLTDGSGKVKTRQIGAKFVSPEIIVKFKAGVEEAQVKALESEIGLKHKKTIPELNLIVFTVTSPKILQEVIAACQKMAFVEYAEINQMVRIKK